MFLERTNINFLPKTQMSFFVIFTHILIINRTWPIFNVEYFMIPGVGMYIYGNSRNFPPTGRCNNIFVNFFKRICTFHKEFRSKYKTLKTYPLPITFMSNSIYIVISWVSGMRNGENKTDETFFFPSYFRVSHLFLLSRVGRFGPKIKIKRS